MTDLETKRAKNAERQRRFRERQKMRNAHDYRAKNAERQRRFRERSAADPSTRMLVYISAHPNITARELCEALGDLPLDLFVRTLEALIQTGRVSYQGAVNDHRLTVRPTL